MSTVLAALVIGVIDAARDIATDAIDKDKVDRAITNAGIDPTLLEDPDARVPLEQHIKLWSILATQRIGLDLGKALGMNGMGVVGYAMRHGRTVGEALTWLQRLKAVIHPEVVPAHTIEDDALVFARPISPVFARLREPVEAQAGALVSVMRALSGRELPVLRVAFPLPRPDDAERHDRFFGCPVTWAAPLLEVAFPASALALELPRNDPRLFAYLARKAEALAQRLPSEASHVETTRHHIGELLASGEARLGTIAQRLGLSERTLHRRLGDEGASFAGLLEEVRRERAQLLLEDRGLSCSEVAFLLGYTETAPFFRAFRRWTGTTPQVWRRNASA